MTNLMYAFLKYIKINIIFRLRYMLIYFFKKEKKILKNTDEDYRYLIKLGEDGYVKINNFFDPEFINLVKLNFDECYKNNFDNFFFNKNISSKNFQDKIDVNNVSQITNYVSLKNPILSLPQITLFLNKRLYNLIQSYFKSQIGLTSINLRKSFVNNLNDADTNFYHKDENSWNLLKVFIYLNDVGNNSGPFVYVKKTHKDLSLNILKNYRISDDVINNNFSQDKIVNLTGKVGDIIIANTRGLHKGKKVISDERNMLTFTFGIHDEYFDKKSKVKIDKSIYFNYKKIDKRFFSLAITN
jgi:hypothetical protein